ncbi:hypothetical protein SOI76_11295 [Acinetobacter pittii]|uniref:hypothetical protein n=1 Tax=Acinetobacter pittii TaxID=48296 RepID=UPI000CE47F49|nr:hypothetical protein [Acinetobacter pittii]PPC04475.1 hypothetical protein ApiMCR8900_14140 [Acinetobacter pittii]WPP58026.1 hypothetical protein SOI76_11295 [Acinetobacter pittii]
MQTEINNWISAEFGYYPQMFNVTAERFSIQTLANFEEDVDLIKNDPNIQKDWIYPGPALKHDVINGKTLKSYTLTFYNESQELVLAK